MGSSLSENLEYPDLVNWLKREARIETIRFGLNAVKNIGGNAVDAILEVRDEYGSLFDFLEFIKEVVHLAQLILHLEDEA